jgi:hypothetical protein
LGFVYNLYMAEKQHLATKVEPKVKQGVRELARREQRTMSQTVALLLIEALQARQSKETVQP